MSWTWSSIACNEVHGSRNENYNVDGITCEVTLRVSAALKNDLINDLMYNGVWPDPYLLYPPQVKSCVATPIATATPAATVPQSYVYDAYNVKVNFSTDEAEDLVAETLEPTAEFMRLDHTFFRWKSNGAPLSPGEAPGVLRPKMKLTREFFNKSAVPSAYLLAGHVHNASYTSPTFGITFAAKTLMLVPQPVSTTKTTGGAGKFNYGVDFLYEPQEWNKFLRIDQAAYDGIITPTGADFISYPLANLLSLLT